MNWTLTPAEFIYLDLFPATVTDTEDGKVFGDELRVVVTENCLYVLQDTPDGPEMLFKEMTRTFSGTNKTGYTVETFYNIYQIKRAANCGCGAMLRGIHLFPDAVYVRPTS